MSLRPSPIKLKDKIVKKITPPGKKLNEDKI